MQIRDPPVFDHQNATGPLYRVEVWLRRTTFKKTVSRNCRFSLGLPEVQANANTLWSSSVFSVYSTAAYDHRASLSEAECDPWWMVMNTVYFDQNLSSQYWFLMTKDQCRHFRNPCDEFTGIKRLTLQFSNKNMSQARISRQLMRCLFGNLEMTASLLFSGFNLPSQ